MFWHVQPRYPLNKRLVGAPELVRMLWTDEKIPCSCQEIICVSFAIRPVARSLCKLSSSQLLDTSIYVTSGTVNNVFLRLACHAHA